VADKPAGLLSVPGIGPEKADCLARRMAERYAGARIVHRLDRDTSGVIVLARDADTHRHLSLQFQEREVSKTYIAVVAGVIRESHGTIDLPMRKDFDHSPRQCIDFVRGRPSVTHWSVTSRGGDRTRVTLTPVTGRSHQLRVHLKTIGHPILGDELYAPPEIVVQADRLLLHAGSLTFRHPDHDRSMTFVAPTPF